MKGKEKKERYIHLNAEFQRIARRDEKAFLSDEYKEIEETNKMGKTSDLFKKIRDTKGTFHAKISTIKDRSSMDLKEAEDTKKRWQEYTEELYKKDLCLLISCLQSRSAVILEPQKIKSDAVSSFPFYFS